MTEDISLDIKNLNIKYKTRSGTVHAVKNAEFTLHKRETLGVVGESGCGKSTTGHALLRLLPQNAVIDGEVLYKNDNILDYSNEKMRKLRGSDISIIFQDPMTSLDPIMRVKDHFFELIKAHKANIKEDEMREIAENALESVGVSKTRLDNYPFEFSGGMRQRVMIALGISLKPAVLIADEPTTSLDVVVQEQIMEVLRNLKKTQDMSIMLITHDLGVVSEVADKVVVMYAGEVIEYSDVYSLYATPLHPYTQLLLQSIPNVKLLDMELKYIPGSLPDLKHPPKGCRFYQRCPFAKDICKDKEVPFVTKNDRRVRCWLYG